MSPAFDSLESFLNMGEYAQFVWPCYVLAALTFLGLIYWAIAARAHAKREVEALEK